MSSQNPNIETPAAPEWLQKLENRREKLARSKLGHELGAGAPCDDCGDKCPGLDLHFWRKVCRNCKCRKDKHRCPDDDLLSGWAQFEILGQIRSKPAFIKIKALSAQVQLEWVPPNAAPDLVSDYMEKLGTSQIPIAGSNAAQKRKQQLEYQVPAHDLDAALCDNLTESEANQLLQYAQRIRESCVGQGNVVRIGGNKISHCKTDAFPIDTVLKTGYELVMATLNEDPVIDPTLAELLSSEKLVKAIISENSAAQPTTVIHFSQLISGTSLQEYPDTAALPERIKVKLCGFNKQAIGSLVYNGPIYDKILGALKSKNFDISRDVRLGPIADFRREYLLNAEFRQEIDRVLESGKRAQYTPVKSALQAPAFHSPLPVTHCRYGTQMCQETPMRRSQFGGTSTILYDCGLPSNIDYERDPVFAQIVKSVSLKNAFERSGPAKQETAMIVSATPMTTDLFDEPTLTSPLLKKLSSFPVNKRVLQSVILNESFYGSLLNIIREKNINIDKCELLSPIKKLHGLLTENKAIFEAARAYVMQLPNSYAMSYDSPHRGVKSALTGSNSNDSGFDSKPTTPNAAYLDDLHALSGQLTAIPAIEDMNMYPAVEPSGLLQDMQNLFVSRVKPFDPDLKTELISSIPILKCQDCTLPIHFGEVAVKAERAGREIAWHPECFKCQTCRELLADLVYFFHGGQVYCGRDLAIKLKIPRCKACDELIFTKEYTAAEGATFHIKHFCCFQCDKPLAGQQYVPDEKSNMPLCLNCYEEYFAACCQYCKRPIEASEQGVAWANIHWHASCFMCSGLNCGKSLIGGRFCVKDNMPFCSPACVLSIMK